jgi:hypothetical protein
VAVVVPERRSEKFVVPGQRRAHGLRIGLPQRSRTLDVCEEERDGAGRKISHGHPPALERSGAYRMEQGLFGSHPNFQDLVRSRA